ncbi:MAG: NAD-dependent epimerase/dehydratase family protein [Pseudoclavibacter sp.]|nr:NAD-dependent epimerase/dehydratase family protein [Pseudoclavibacter sp.]
MTIDPVLVTGASGLLGSAVVHELLGRGASVLALARSPEKAGRVLGEHPGLRVEAGDVNDPGLWPRILPRVRGAVHTAAYFREYYRADHGPEGDALLHRTNVGAPGALLAAAEEHGLEAVVHIGSTAQLAPGDVHAPADEDSPDAPSPNAYARSKIEAEGLVLEHRGRLRVPVIMPGWMWGPRDAGPTAAGRFALSVARGRLRAVPDCGNHLVDARDVAFACVEALERGRHGRRYLVAGRWRRLAELCERIAAAASETGGRRVRAPRVIPPSLATGLAWTLETLARLSGQEPIATRASVRVLTAAHHDRVSSARAQRELGVRFRPLAETLDDTVGWYARNGFLDPARAQSA